MSLELKSFDFPSGQSFSLRQGDLTQEEVGAIVNAANQHLMHGGGIAAIIARKGGPVITTESAAWVKQHGPVSHQEPAYTSAGDLPCRYVIHAVGPVWGSGDEDNKLADAITGSLRRAEELELSSIAFPAISTGIFGFPKDRAAGVIFQAVKDYFAQNPESSLSDVRMMVYDQPTTDVFQSVWEETFGDG
jgi:O-acetyl-ADP-ribose deacetylase (regulator of RNase III)